ncbi:MAG: hypothetical protein A2W85_15615 [Bacteroidetes bacterium GWF2_41_31]|nr:MAG: hypothetical protein A2W85_15615 [Bacteroidetes bacterium GWF2_41_31]OFZ07024.1 MAG: hypothetical protein A2338_02025 [Bacteroidetes bacterium RIFOXYB12_FULL_41_6]
MKKLTPYLLVFVQLSSLLFLFVSAPMLSISGPGLLVEAAGVFFGLRAIFVMKIGNFRIAPLIKVGSVLVTSGPYKYIRHPMYLAQVVVVAPLVVDYFSWVRLAVILILIVNLLVKIQFEEKQLINHFPDYAEYRKNSWKLIPFLY